MTNSFDAAWDALYSPTAVGPVWQEKPIPVIEQTIEKLLTERATTVLDVGAGDGRNLAPIVRAGLQCAGLDISVRALQRVESDFSSSSHRLA